MEMKNNGITRSWELRPDGKAWLAASDDLKAENAALRGRAEALEWLVERIDPCVICGEPADHFALHYTDDGWDPPFHFWLCREHQRALIEPVQEAIKKMKEERDAQV